MRLLQQFSLCITSILLCAGLSAGADLASAKHAYAEKDYLQGAKDLPRDPVQAEMWLRLAAKDNLEFYENALRSAEGQMSPEQIAKGKALAEAWKPQHGLRPEDTTKPDEKPKS